MLHLTEILDTIRIKIFYTWNYGVRGDYEIWSKESGDDMHYSCWYKKEEDTAYLRIYRQAAFLKDFPTMLKFDTPIYRQVNINMHGGKIFRILSVDHHGQDHITDTMSFADQVFQRNPFTHFRSLSALKDSLGVYGISSDSRIGNFITFWLSREYTLTYLPDDLNVNLRYKKHWMADFAKSKMITKNWQLRKLDKPRDSS